MKLSIFSNYFNSHQLPLAEELSLLLGPGFTFVSLIDTDGAIGRESLDDKYPYVLKEYDGLENETRAMEHALSDDVVVFGDMAGKEEYVRARAATGKLFFRYSERLLKRGDWWRFVPFKRYRTWNRFTRYSKVNMYVLCSSSYTASDLALFGFPNGKCLKWGYFPEVKSDLQDGNEKPGNSFCSVQRLVALKHVEDQVLALQYLNSNGYDMSLCIGGDGPDRVRLERYVDSLGMGNRIRFVGELDRQGVQALMRRSQYFMATSDRREGWGATVNEAMASECCVIASNDMGCTDFLIQDGLNGYSYSGGKEGLIKKLMQVVQNSGLSAEIGRNGAKTIRGEWSAREAANRLVRISDSALVGDITPMVDGPMSLA